MLDWFKLDIKPRQGMSTCVLPDELVVDILSRLPLKSLCRFKCVCKSWLAFSSHPYYRQKLPRIPTGLLYRKREHGRLPWSLGTAIHLARLPSSDKKIDTALSFVPCYKYPIQLQDCSNGLLLCYQGGWREEISNAIVCNPATQEWMSLPNTEPGPSSSGCDLVLCFDPSWSQHFHVLSFQFLSSTVGEAFTEVKIFFSENFIWSSCRWRIETRFQGSPRFLNGVLYVNGLLDHVLLAIDAPDPCTRLLSQRIIQLPGFPNDLGMFSWCSGCLCQSLGVLCYAQQEFDGCMMRIWSLEGTDSWVVRHRLSMNNVFGRDLLLRTDHNGFRRFDYDIFDFDLGRELVILVDRIDHKIISFSISTGKGSEILKVPEFGFLYGSQLYVPYYGKFPASVLQRAEDEWE